ncbi:hypothetical protein PT015_17420 [Candidatus Mycobacterium wuenschmannii]|uniref:Secreted protein n=1 Tax=Candidatus Mycobacterium wuenschmannii TaxID=3027808 RepID=A0ABY8VSQ1_9MYCO|nr:hypothetical protein [Candidatus Mycobacterium wuenschmannii]WIM86659.1 hypothetical protein PT015_17420 [Candidatus Mycobacterium wuenschmannii]
MADDASSSTSRRRVTLLIGIVVLAAAGIAATVWFNQGRHHSAGPQDDCGIVEQLGPKWTKMQESITTLQNGPGETKDLLAIADAESTMADDIRAAQGSVTGADLKTQLGGWADGTALTAKGQRAAANGVPTGADNDSMRAATLTFNATSALKKACPNLQLSPTSRS